MVTGWFDSTPVSNLLITLKTKYMDNKHKSKLYKGFEKQVKRQDAKPSEVEIILPCSIKLPKNFKGVYTHSIVVSNNKWNGMNLKVLRNKFDIIRVGGMYGKFTIINGKYRLSFHGKSLLKKKTHTLNRMVTAEVRLHPCFNY